MKRERAIATNKDEDICDTQINIDVNQIKNDATKPGNQLYLAERHKTKKR